MPRRRTASEQGSATAELFATGAGPAVGGVVDAWARARGYRQVAGVDEAGRGPLAGPVVAAAVVLPERHAICGLADSKTLGAETRARLAAEIRTKAEAVGIGVVSPARIDQTDILRASLEAMARALAEVLAQGVRPDAVLVDGRDVFELPDGAPVMHVRAFVKGDQRSVSIGAASIVAKVHRDALMMDYHNRWPVYGFDRHKGYPTGAHRRALAEHGPCAIHRRSFRGVGRGDAPNPQKPNG